MEDYKQRTFKRNLGKVREEELNASRRAVRTVTSLPASAYKDAAHVRSILESQVKHNRKAHRTPLTGGGAKADRQIGDIARYSDSPDHRGTVKRNKITPRATQSKRGGAGARNAAKASSMADRIIRGIKGRERWQAHIPSSIPGAELTNIEALAHEYCNASSNRQRKKALDGVHQICKRYSA